MSTELGSVAERTGRATNIHIYYAASIGFEHYHHAPITTSPAPPAPTAPPASPSLSSLQNCDTTHAAPSALPSGSGARARGAR